MASVEQARRGTAPPPRPMARRVAIGALSMLGFAAFGFWRPGLSRLPGAFDGYTHLHAVLGALWLPILAAQAALVLRRALRAHRARGRITRVVAPGFVVSGLLLAQHRFSRMSPETVAKEGTTLYLPMVMAGLFAVACALAISDTRNTPLHARPMASTALPLIDPVFARVLFFHLPALPSLWRVQAISFSVTGGVAFALLRSFPHDAPGRASYRNFVLLTGLALSAWFVVPLTEPWMRFAAWFRGLPLT